MAELQTERLLLRQWRDEDAAPFAALNADPEVMRYIGAGTPLDREASDRLLARIREEWLEQRFGLWAVEERDTGELLGFCGLAVPMVLPVVLPAVEIGWRLARPAWGRGLATEASRAALDWAFSEHAPREVIAIVDPRNARSLRVAEKLGMEPRPDRVHPQTGRRLRVLGTLSA